MLSILTIVAPPVRQVSSSAIGMWGRGHLGSGSGLAFPLSGTGPPGEEGAGERTRTAAPARTPGGGHPKGRLPPSPAYVEAPDVAVTVRAAGASSAGRAPAAHRTRRPATGDAAPNERNEESMTMYVRLAEVMEALRACVTDYEDATGTVHQKPSFTVDEADGCIVVKPGDQADVLPVYILPADRGYAVYYPAMTMCPSGDDVHQVLHRLFDHGR